MGEIVVSVHVPAVIMRYLEQDLVHGQRWANPHVIEVAQAFPHVDAQTCALSGRIGARSVDVLKY